MSDTPTTPRTAIDAIFTTFPRIETPRLTLRRIEQRDAEALFPVFSDEQVMEYYGNPVHRALADTQEQIRMLDHWYARREGIRWGIARKDDPDETLIGSCGFFLFDEAFQRAETGYELRRDCWRQGIMREALSAALTFAFTTMGLHRVEAVVDDGNDASQGLLRALGFTHEGRLRQRFFFRDRFWDEHYFGLLADEWQEGSRA